jgi:REP element-mobilizing transposase RayT
LSKVYVHITFSTKKRHPFIDNAIKEELWRYLGGICKKLEYNPIRVGRHNDHVPIRCLSSKKITLINLLEEIKKKTSNTISTYNNVTPLFS